MMTGSDRGPRCELRRSVGRFVSPEGEIAMARNHYGTSSERRVFRSVCEDIGRYLLGMSYERSWRSLAWHAA